MNLRLGFARKSFLFSTPRCDTVGRCCFMPPFLGQAPITQNCASFL